jgi:hypothetical protein
MGGEGRARSALQSCVVRVFVRMDSFKLDVVHASWISSLLKTAGPPLLFSPLLLSSLQLSDAKIYEP